MGSISTISISLKTEKWQEDVLFRRFEVCRSIYNAMLGYELKQYRKLTTLNSYKEAINIINSAYKANTDKEKKKIKASAEYKDAIKTQKKLLREYGFSEFQFGATAIKYSEHFRGIIPTMLAQRSIGAPMWIAFDKLFFGNGETVHFKNYDTWNSIVTDGRSGIRIVSEDNKTVKKMDSSKKYYCLYSVKEGKNLKMPIKIDKKDLYLIEMAERDIHTVRITRKKVNGTYKYYVQLSVTGAPAIKYDSVGKELHPVGDNKIGVYIDTTSITIASKNGFSVIDIRTRNKLEDKIAEINRYLDNSRRANNPDNFNDDGTVKKVNLEQGKRVRLKWKNSNSYEKARNKKANLQRIQAEQRKIRANKIANEIMAMGSDIIINDYPFQAAAMRKKYEEGEEKNEKGRFKNKAKAGKAIGENAPAMIVTVLDTKLKGRGFAGVVKKKITNIDYSKEDYRKFYASELLRELL
ncbi:hypothetical protein [Butyrivibrio fibrisolvens]|uniref:hypothetical protein n=1 Tax=Butyrivibrio fibrisolvens TaxID=831 RepID=UPI0003B4AEE1|nr:hypothetical protein [Butyrivibrio fibrisolvens]